MEEKIFRAKFKKFDPEGDTAAEMNISALQLEPFLEELGMCSSCMRFDEDEARTGSVPVPVLCSISSSILYIALFYIILYPLSSI